MAKPYYEDEWVTLHHGDCRAWFADDGYASDVSYLGPDALVTDPPFNVGKDYGTSSDDLGSEEYQALMEAVAGYGPDVQAWVTPTNRLTLFADALGASARPVIVRRGAQGPKRWGWYDQFDMLLVRGKPSTYVSNLWDDIRLKGEGYFFREEHFDHPGYTPFQILARLTALLTPEGGTVFDPFAGTGTTLVAAKSQNRRAVGVELDERWCEVAASRLAQDVLDFGKAA